jgi:hypothetical protein
MAAPAPPPQPLILKLIKMLLADAPIMLDDAIEVA